MSTNWQRLSRKLILYGQYAMSGAVFLIVATAARRLGGPRGFDDHAATLRLAALGASIGLFLCALRPLRSRGIGAAIARWVLSAAATGALVAATELGSAEQTLPAWQVVATGAGAGAVLGVCFWWVARNLELKL